jgi:hypothetical protein
MLWENQLNKLVNEQLVDAKDRRLFVRKVMELFAGIRTDGWDSERIDEEVGFIMTTWDIDLSGEQRHIFDY